MLFQRRDGQSESSLKKCSSIMNELQKVPEFGIEGYRMPNPSKIHFEKPLTFRMIKAKKEDNFIT